MNNAAFKVVSFRSNDLLKMVQLLAKAVLEVIRYNSQQLPRHILFCNCNELSFSELDNIVFIQNLLNQMR